MLGEAIRRHRLALGMKQATLAEHVGTGQSYISEIEKGVRTNLTRDLLQRIAAALGVSVDQLEREAAGQATADNSAPPPVDELRAIGGWTESRIADLLRRWASYSEEEQLEIIQQAREMYQGQQEVERRRKEQQEKLEALLRRRKPAT